jgi:hypothetical protein
MPVRFLRDVLRILAIAFNIPVARLLPHSLRYGALLHIAAAGHDDHTKMAQGAWESLSGMRHYWRATTDHARAVASDLHDPSLAPLSHLVHTYTSA